MLRRFRMVPAYMALILLVGCGAQVGVRTYDPYYHDYHTWNDAEVATLQCVDRRNPPFKRRVRTHIQARPRKLLEVAARSSLRISQCGPWS